MYRHKSNVAEICAENQPNKVRNSVGKWLSCLSGPGAHGPPGGILYSQSKTLLANKNRYRRQHNHTLLPPPSTAWPHRTPHLKGWRRIRRRRRFGTGGGCWSFHAGIECAKGYTSRGLALSPSIAPLPFKIPLEN